MDISTVYDTDLVRLHWPIHLWRNQDPRNWRTKTQGDRGRGDDTVLRTVNCGVAAGGPQAPLLAKAYLAPALVPWVEHHPHMHLSGWVDNVGYDCEGP